MRRGKRYPSRWSDKQTVRSAQNTVDAVRLFLNMPPLYGDTTVAKHVTDEMRFGQTYRESAGNGMTRSDA